MFEGVIYFSVLYFLCYFKEISTDILEEQVSEEIDPDLNEEEDIRMEDITEEHSFSICYTSERGKHCLDLMDAVINI